MEQTHPVVLEYATLTATPSRPHWWSLMVLGLWLPALVVPFLDFAWGVSPLDEASKFRELLSDWERFDHWLSVLAMGFFVGQLAVLWKARLLIGRLLIGAPGRRELRLMACVTVLANMPLVLWLAACLHEIATHWPQSRGLWQEPYWLPTATVIWVFELAVAASLWSTGDRPSAIDAALSGTFIAIGLMCLIKFHDFSPDTGYLLTAVPVCAGLVDVSAWAWRIAGCSRRIRCA